MKSSLQYRYAENTRKRPESQVKLLRITVKVQKIMFHSHENFEPYNFFERRQNFVGPSDPYDQFESLTHTTHETPHPHYLALFRLIWTTKTIV